ncbi:MAG TPA: laccase domain-containing protein, partial [Solirubrobacteraceae bacterium]|nr:laccase domain-containing protein [Solirubrobacteraceae bacterium]
MSGFETAGEHLAIALPGGRALFTTRRGGVSEGPYASLNLGSWTDDEPGRVEENRRRAAAIAGGARLAQGHHVHGTRVDTVRAPPAQPSDADGQATAARDLAPIVLVADCL